ncbi:MAG: RagB/SusD family nutrient uptake outer membrane protein [Bacteroidales bacterium]|nr:RagB/SusD family nutrient uptake outer membrane protein [Bacteroidales bacterium]
MKKIFVIGLAALALASCNMDFYSSDAMTGDQLAQNPDAAFYTTDGIYTYFMDKIAYKGQSGGESGNYYIRHYFQLAELRGDNVTVSGITEDPFINPYRYTDDNTAKNIYYSWWIAYKIIYSANSNIESIKPGVSNVTDHLIGENYFFRAIAHFHMVTLYAMPYADGRDNMGVPLRLSTDTFTTTRATVGEVYDAIVNDLITAKEFLSKGEAERNPGGSKAYISLDAARALLARVYLYMGENQKCIDECNELLDHAPSSVTSGYDFADYPTHTYDHPETIWCIRLEPTFEWAVDHGEASIASMYIKDGIGWGEHYWREDLIDLFRRNPDDKRFNAYFRMVDPRPEKDLKAGEEYKPLKTYAEMQKAMDGNLSVVYPIPGGSGEYCTGSAAIGCKYNADGSVSFQSQGEQIGTTLDGMGKEIPVFKYYDHIAKRKIEHGRDTIYYVDNSDTHFPGKDINGVKRVWVRPGPAHPKPKNKTNPDTGEKYPETQADADARYKAAIGRTDNGGFYMRYYNTKFSGQDGKVMMTSPVFLRWGEVVLNRAEAYAKLGQDGNALEDVNTIRRRAGNPELGSGDLSGLGYGSMLDLVLDERRMELCFEGHRFFDVFRNRLPMDRRYIGYHTWEIIQPGDPRIALLIPQDEINSAGIPQNPR